MTDNQITDFSYLLSDRFEELNIKYIRKMVKHLMELGKLTPSDINRLERMQLVGADITEIREEMDNLIKTTMTDVNTLFSTISNDIYMDRATEFAFKGIDKESFLSKHFIKDYIASVSKVTNDTFQNIARTTVIDKPYQEAVDKAIQAITTGTDNYNNVVRSIVKDYGQGMRVTYDSGLTRRLDSAVRMNILDGARQVNKGVHEEAAKAFGADGFEISAHALCAPDHLEIQGIQVSKEEFEKLQNDMPFEEYDSTKHNAIRRAVGTWNCRHYTFPILLGISQPAYSKEQLQQFKERSNEKVEIDGRQYTKYECTQLMRRLETEMRYAKEQYIIGRDIGDNLMLANAQVRLLRLQKKYREISDLSGLRKRYDKAYVPNYRGQGNNSAPKTFTPKPIDKAPSTTISPKQIQPTVQNTINNTVTTQVKEANQRVFDEYTIKHDTKEHSYLDYQSKEINMSPLDSVQSWIHELGHGIFGNYRNMLSTLNSGLRGNLVSKYTSCISNDFIYNLKQINYFKNRDFYTGITGQVIVATKDGKVLGTVNNILTTDTHAREALSSYITNEVYSYTGTVNNQFIADMYDGITKGYVKDVIGLSGHGIDYYTEDVLNPFNEFFANMNIGTTMLTTPEELTEFYNFIGNHFPNTYNTWLEMANELYK